MEQYFQEWKEQRLRPGRVAIVAQAATQVWLIAEEEREKAQDHTLFPRLQSFEAVECRVNSYFKNRRFVESRSHDS
ncbi:hypothetical protein ONZ45_g10594 [Pleurotus djamor]|nr:hypothetical protein ONZ45_g10594 [Pleurotus djamor]